VSGPTPNRLTAEQEESEVKLSNANHDADVIIIGGGLGGLVTGASIGIISWESATCPSMGLMTNPAGTPWHGDFKVCGGLQGGVMEGLVRSGVFWARVEQVPG
jgi:hypothetical protein